MKHKHDENSVNTQPITVTPAQINEALGPHPDLPPQSEELKRIQSLFGTPVRAVTGPRVETVILTDFDGGKYNGAAIRVGKTLDTNDPIISVAPVIGLSRYPDETRPNEIFQYVLPGEDEAPLINIAEHNRPHAAFDGSTVENNPSENPQEGGHN